MTIKQIDVKNMFGIKNFSVDFRAKNVAQDSGLQEQVIKNENEFFSLIPSFLAKNAAGKTSFIKAVSFALKFGNRESFINELSFYIFKLVEEMNLNSWETNENEYVLDKNRAGYDLINKLFEQVSFAGSSESIVEIKTDLGVIKVELTPESFFVVLNNEKINILKLLNSINLNEFQEKTFAELRDLSIKKSKEILNNKSFYSYSFNTLLKADIMSSKINDFYRKYVARKDLMDLIKNWGAKAVKTILKKIDDNIDQIETDIESSSILISLKSNPGIHISPQNLSFGTQKIIEILAKSLSIFKNGGIMMIDEIENGMHLSLIKLLTAIYSDKNINTKNAQILFTTHNPLIFKMLVVHEHNIYMEEDGNFINIAKSKAISRTEDKIKSITPKNYYNNYFWLEKDINDKTTVSDYEISQIIENIQLGSTCPKR